AGEVGASLEVGDRDAQVLPLLEAPQERGEIQVRAPELEARQVLLEIVAARRDRRLAARRENVEGFRVLLEESRQPGAAPPDGEQSVQPDRVIGKWSLLRQALKEGDGGGR